MNNSKPNKRFIRNDTDAAANMNGEQSSSKNISDDSENLTARYGLLQRKIQELQQARFKKEFALEEVEKNIASCIKQAQDLYQVNTLEELSAYITEQAHKERLALIEFEEKIKAELELQQNIDIQLSQMDASSHGQ